MSINILSLNNWLDLFDLNIISEQIFLNTYKVKSSKITNLNDKNLSEGNKKILYTNIIINKKKYLTNFYNKSLKYNNKLNFNDITDFTLKNNKYSNYKNLIRNIYYKDILLYTKTDIKNLRPFLEVLFDLFNNKIIDYKLLTPSSLDLLKKNKFSNVLSGFYFRSSILNPVITYSLAEKYMKGSKVFTPTLGWSSYMYGFFSNNNITEYVGTDVIKHVCNNTKKLSKKLFPNKIIDIYESPSEKLLNNKTFMNKYTNYFDIIFFSPPYFKLELYRGKNQSTELYKNYDDWLSKYWEVTIQLCRKVLKKNGNMAYIIGDYDKNYIVKDMNNITKKYFTYKKKKKLSNKNIDFTKHKDTNEIIYFFK
jgi:hypothetical protein|tara:strand:+ start:50 stop:1144 length:1095 start_codon:yes stop_codon:yes gene_type:complete